MGEPERSTERRHLTLPLSDFRRLAAILGVALVVRAVVAVRTAAIFNDGPRFLRIAQDLHRGDWEKGLSDAYHPLYSLLIQLTHVCFSFFSIPSWEAAAVACSVLAGALAVVPLYAFVRRAFDPTAAWIAALALAVHPYAVRFSADVQSDAVYLLLFLCAVALLYRALSQPRAAAGWAFASGLASGLAYLTRPEGIVVPVVAVLLWGIAMARTDRRPGIGWRWLAALAAGTLVCATPYWMAIRRLTGIWRVSQKKSIFDLLGVGDALPAETGEAASGVFATLGEPLLLMAVLVVAAVAGRASLRWFTRREVSDVGRRWGAAGLALLAVLAFVVLAPDAAGHFGAVFVSTLRPELLLLVAVGVASTWRGAPHPRAVFVCVFLAVHAVVFVGLLLNAGYLDRRHVLPPVVLLFGWVGVGAPALAEVVRTALQRIRVVRGPAAGSGATATLIVVLAMVAIGLPKSLADHRSEERAARRAAEWLSEQPLPAGRVAALRSKFAYYAKREWVPLVTETKLRPVRALLSERVRYVIAEAGVHRGGLDLVAHLRDAGGREVFQVGVDGRQAFVFELTREAGS